MTSRERGRSTKSLISDELDRRFFTAMVDTNQQVVRIIDDELRSQVARLRDRISSMAIVASSEDEANRIMDEGMHLYEAINERKGGLRGTLY